MYDVITMGSATVDVFGVISKKLQEPKPGDKVLIEKIDFEIGGGGVNSAIAFSRMGLKAAFLGKVGHDHNGFNIISSHELTKDELNQVISILEKKTKKKVFYKIKIDSGLIAGDRKRVV